MANSEFIDLLRRGVVIPAHPLALTAQRKLDERRQVALTRYYCAAGAGGIAVGVHTTQFAIREPRFNLYAPLLHLAANTVAEYERAANRRVIRVAGICGPTAQAVREGAVARDAGYDLGLLSLAALRDAPDADLLAHCRTVGQVLPLCGFYLQPSVGGRLLSYEFWREFCRIPSVIAIKVAPFNRYQTLDVLRGVADSGRASEIALYTGNDDNIIPDLLTEFRLNSVPGASHAIPDASPAIRDASPAIRDASPAIRDASPNQSRDREGASLRFRGGLLGQWAVWTRRAVELLEHIHASDATAQILAQSAALTDANSALFDVRHGFAGCIAGIHEILRRQGLLAGRWCLDPDEDLSPGQMEEIDRVCAAYPELTDDAFVRENLDDWLR